MKSLTFIIPVFNEEKNITNVFDELLKIKKKLSEKYKIFFLFADNNSTDNSFKILNEIAKSNNFVRLIKYSRNYGYQRSILTAIKHSETDGAVIIDCDLQDPPELILQFIKYWEKGYKNIYGIRSKRKESWVKLRSIYYKLINKLSDIEMPENAGDFRLLDKVIINYLKNIDHDNPYVRGLVASAGYKSVGIEYERKKRIKGQSSAGFFKLLLLAIRSITQFSNFPIRLLSIFGIIILIIIFLLIIFIIFIRIYFGTNSDIFLSLPKGFTTTWILILITIGINSLFLGIIGEYVSNIHDEILKKNKVNIQKKVNFDK